MPLLYLHQRSSTDCVEDPEGLEFENLDAAINEAVAAARDLMATQVREGVEPDGWRFEITDSRGTILAVIPFRDTLSHDGSVEERKSRWIIRPDVI